MIEVLIIVGVAVLGAVLGFVCGRWGRRSCDEQRWFSFTCMCGYRLVTDDPELLTSVMHTHVCSGFKITLYTNVPPLPKDGELLTGPQGTAKPGDRPNTTHPEVF